MQNAGYELSQESGQEWITGDRLNVVAAFIGFLLNFMIERKALWCPFNPSSATRALFKDHKYDHIIPSLKSFSCSKIENS